MRCRPSRIARRRIEARRGPCGIFRDRRAPRPPPPHRPPHSISAHTHTHTREHARKHTIPTPHTTHHTHASSARPRLSRASTCPYPHTCRHTSSLQPYLHPVSRQTSIRARAPVSLQVAPRHVLEFMLKVRETAARIGPTVRSIRDWECLFASGAKDAQHTARLPTRTSYTGPTTTSRRPARIICDYPLLPSDAAAGRHPPFCASAAQPSMHRYMIWRTSIICPSSTPTLCRRR